MLLINFVSALAPRHVCPRANGFNFENPFAIEKSVGLLLGDAMRSGDYHLRHGVNCVTHRYEMHHCGALGARCGVLGGRSGVETKRRDFV